MDGAEVAPDDLDPEALAQSIEELEIQARIRAIEMEVGLLDLRRELEIQEEHVQEWQSELRKNHSTKTGQVHADFENAQRGVEELRKRVQTMEAARPTSRVPSPPREASAAPAPAPASAPAPAPPAVAPSEGAYPAAQARVPPRAPVTAPVPGPEELAKRAVARAPLPGGPKAKARAGSRGGDAAAGYAGRGASGGSSIIEAARGSAARSSSRGRRTPT